MQAKLLSQFLLALSIFVGLLNTASAHEVRPAYLQIERQQQLPDRYLYNVLWKQPIVQNGRLAIDPIFPDGCTTQEQGAPELTPNALLHQWTVECDLRQAKIHISGLSVTLTDVMVSFIDLTGESKNYILRPSSPTLDLKQGGDSPFSYLVIGIEHLLLGIDHVLFVIGLVLFLRNPWTLLKTITAFTVAHSITLGLSVMGWIRLEQGPVEAVIALSILFLARELSQPEALRSRLTQGGPWIMAFIFGLLHGLGFAGALTDIGLPQDSLWLALLLFNVGIELGQIFVIALVLGFGWICVRLTSQDSVQIMTRYGVYAMGCVAAYWTIDRTWLLM